MKNNGFLAPNAKSLRSSFLIVEASLAIKPSRKGRWELQQRLPRHVANSIREEREERARRGFPVHG